jgi:hypothetical protein
MTLVQLIGGPCDGQGYEWPEGYGSIQIMSHYDQPVYHLTQCGKGMYHLIVVTRQQRKTAVPEGEELV